MPESQVASRAGERWEVQVSIRDFSVWHVGVVVLTGSVVAALGAWWLQATRAHNDTIAWLALSLAIAAVGLGVSLWRIRPATLRFDGSSWLLWDGDHENSQPIAGDVHVSVDLGVWLLLRFVSPMRALGARTRWLPVQPGASKHQWHALRCAIYSSRRSAQDEAAKEAKVE